MKKGFFLFKIRKRKSIEKDEIKRMMKESEKILEDNKEMLNTINVFPVPDGDTGTNMHNTVKGIINSEDMLMGALENARGNSGMIFSQFFIGFLKTLPDKARIGDLSNAFSNGYNQALSILDKPREGTMITVMRKAAEMMENWKEKTSNITKAFAWLVKELREEVEKTKERLDILKKTNVVDSGALGFLYIMEGWNRYLGGKPVNLEGFVNEPVFVGEFNISHRFCTQILIETKKSSKYVWGVVKNHGIDVRTIEGDGKVKIHLHTNHPHKVAEELEKIGLILDMRIEDMLAAVNSGVKNARDYYRFIL